MTNQSDANPQSLTPTEELRQLKEKLAAIEHERWSDWQKWCHQVIRENVPRTDELEAVLARWDRQIEVPYELLTDSEKVSDMEQVDRYWPLILDLLDRVQVEAQRKELELLEPYIDEMLDNPPIVYYWRNRIATLTQEKGQP